MILKLLKEINKKIRCNCTIWLYAIIYAIYRIFLHSFSLILEKNFFILYKESKKIEK